jgi:hypothetical protein
MINTNTIAALAYTIMSTHYALHKVRHTLSPARIERIKHAVEQADLFNPSARVSISRDGSFSVQERPLSANSVISTIRDELFCIYASDIEAERWSQIDLSEWRADWGRR